MGNLTTAADVDAADADAVRGWDLYRPWGSASSELRRGAPRLRQNAHRYSTSGLGADVRVLGPGARQQMAGAAVRGKTTRAAGTRLRWMTRRPPTTKATTRGDCGGGSGRSSARTTRPLVGDDFQPYHTRAAGGGSLLGNPSTLQPLCSSGPSRRGRGVGGCLIWWTDV
ncbi:hypothetical protein BKA81DRAFT_345186 [Phyllosticta paracitricarpa]